MRRTYESGIKARLSFSGGSHAPVNMANSMEVNVGGKKPEGNGTLAALYFVRQVFGNRSSSSELPSPFWIQKQSNHRHAPYYPQCLQERVARQKLSLAFVPRTFCS